MSRANTGGATSVLELVRQRRAGASADTTPAAEPGPAPASSVLELVREKRAEAIAQTAQSPGSYGPSSTRPFADYASAGVLGRRVPDVAATPRADPFVGPKYRVGGAALPGMPGDTLEPGQLPADLATARPDLEAPAPRPIGGEALAGAERGVSNIASFILGGSAGPDSRPSPAPEGASGLRRFAQTAAGTVGELGPALAGGAAGTLLTGGAGAPAWAAMLAGASPLAAQAGGAAYERTGDPRAALASAAVTEALAPLQIGGVLGRAGAAQAVEQAVLPRVAAYVARRGADAGFGGVVSVAQAYADEEIAQLAGAAPQEVDPLASFAGGAAVVGGLGVAHDLAGRGLRGVRAAPEGPLVKQRDLQGSSGGQGGLGVPNPEAADNPLGVRPYRPETVDQPGVAGVLSPRDAVAAEQAGVGGGHGSGNLDPGEGGPAVGLAGPRVRPGRGAEEVPHAGDAVQPVDEARSLELRQGEADASVGGGAGRSIRPPLDSPQGEQAGVGGHAPDSTGGKFVGIDESGLARYENVPMLSDGGAPKTPGESEPLPPRPPEPAKALTSAEVDGLQAITDKGNGRGYIPEHITPEVIKSLREKGAVSGPPRNPRITDSGRRRLDEVRAERTATQNAAGDAFDREQLSLIQRIERGDPVSRAEVSKYLDPEGEWASRAKIADEPAKTATGLASRGGTNENSQAVGESVPAPARKRRDAAVENLQDSGARAPLPERFKQVRGPRKGEWSKSEIERRLIRNADQFGYREQADKVDQFQVSAEAESSDSRQYSAGVSTSFSGPTLPREIIDALAGRRHLRKYFKTNVPGGLGMDSMHEIGAERLVDMIESEWAGSKARQLKNTLAFLEEQGDFNPEGAFLAWMHDSLPSKQKNRKPLSILENPAQTLRDADTFTINGKEFRVVVDDNETPYVVSEDAGITVPLQALDSLPFDEGSLRESQAPEPDISNAFSESDLSNLPGVQRGMYGWGSDGGIVGKQTKMFEEGDSRSKLAIEADNQQQKNVAESQQDKETGLMFEGELGDAPAGAAPREAKRSRPVQALVFDKPIVGKSGVELTGYQWSWKMIQELDHRGEEVDRRVSDWDEAAHNETTGRDIVHQFSIARPDGTRDTVSLETALREMGYLDPVDAKPIKNLASTLKTLARNKMQLAALEQQYEPLRKAKEQADAERFPREKVVGEATDPLSADARARGERRMKWSVDGATVFGPTIEKGQPIPTISPERLMTLEGEWRDMRAMAISGTGANWIKRSGLASQIHDLKRRIAKQEQKLGVSMGTDTRADGMEPNDEPAGSGPSASVAAKSLQNMTMQPTGAKQVSQNDLFDAMRDVAGVPIRFGRGNFAQRKAEGWYSPHNKLIRQQARRLIDTGLHEVGHAIHDKQIGWNVIPAGTKAELAGLGRQLYGSRKPNGGYRREGVAEYVARTLLGEDGAALAPRFHDWFTTKFLPSKPEFAAKYADLADKAKRWDAQGARSRLNSQIEKVDAGPISRAKAAASKLAQYMHRRYWTDDAAALQTAEKQLIEQSGRSLEDVKPTERPYTMYRALQMTAPGTARNFIERFASDTSGSEVGPSLKAVLDPIKGRMQDFIDYAVARRAQVLDDRGVRSGVRRQDADFVVNQLKSPELDKAVAGVTAWGDSLLQYLADSGGLTQEGLKVIRDANPVWIPFQRVFEDTELGGGRGGFGRGVVNAGRGVSKIRGSAREIADPLATLAQQAQRVIATANKIAVGRSIADLAEKTPGAAWFAEKVPQEKVPKDFKLEDVRKQLEDAGADLSGADLDAVMTVFDNAFRPTGKDNIVTVWRNGEQEWWELDPEVYRAVTGMDKEVIPSWLAAIVGPPKRAVQLGATGISAGFSLVKNPIRDAWTAMVYGRGGARTPFASMRGLWQDLKGGEYAKKWKAAGGEMTTLMGQDRVEARKLVDEALSSGARNVARHPIDTLRRVLGTWESAPRIEEFRRNLIAAEKKWGKGSRDATIEALLASKEVTSDFTRAGIISRALNQMVPFWNAQVQGTSKFYRVFSGAEGRGAQLRATAAAFSGITLPTMLLWWINHDQEWYKDLPRQEKLGFWHVSLDGGKTIVRLPKPMELGYVFGSLPQAALDSMYGDDPRAAGNALWETAGQFAPIDVLHPKRAAFELLPALLKPGVEAAANYDSFRDRPIVSPFDESAKLPKDLYGRYTTETSKAIGSALDVAPARIEHLLNGYTGGLLTRNIPTAEAMLGWQKRPTELTDIPVAGALFSRPPTGTRSQRYIDMMDRLAELRKKKGSKALAAGEQGELARLERFNERIGDVRDAMDAGRLAKKAGEERIKSLVLTALAPESVAGR